MVQEQVNSSISRRRLLQIAGLAGLGVGAAACAGPGSGGGSSSAPEATGPIEGTVSFAHWRAEDQELLNGIFAVVAEQHPDLEVRQDIFPSTDWQATGLQRIRSGDIGHAFTSFRGSQFSDMASADLYVDLTDQAFVKNYGESFLEAGQLDGRQLALPYHLVLLMPIYNMDLLQEHGFDEMPADWDGFLDMCKKLRGAGIIPLAWPGGEPGNAKQFFNSMVMNNAPSDDMFAKVEAGEYQLTDDWFIQTLEQYAQLRPYFQPNAIGTQREGAQQLFVTGQAAMLTTGTYDVAVVRRMGAEFPIDAFAPITVAADEAKYQGVHNVTWMLGVNRNAEIVAAATAVVEHLSQPEVASEYANNTVQFTTLEGVEYTHPDLKQISPWLDKKTLLAPRYQFEDLDVENAVLQTASYVIDGTAPEQAAADAQRIVDQRIN